MKFKFRDCSVVVMRLVYLRDARFLSRADTQSYFFANFEPLREVLSLPAAGRAVLRTIKVVYLFEQTTIGSVSARLSFHVFTSAPPWAGGPPRHRSELHAVIAGVTDAASVQDLSESAASSREP